MMINSDKFLQALTSNYKFSLAFGLYFVACHDSILSTGADRISIPDGSSAVLKIDGA
jgi:hypothetical protein